MGFGTFYIFLLLSCLNVNGSKLKATPSPTPPLPSTNYTFLTNAYRALHHAPPLTRSPQIETSAQNWADQLSTLCILQHTGDNGLGENLFSSSSLVVNWPSAITRWYNEIMQYKFTATPWITNGGNFNNIGHATQLLWVSSSFIGCAFSISHQVKSAICPHAFAVYVCQYSAEGNVGTDAEFFYNVLPQ